MEQLDFKIRKSNFQTIDYSEHINKINALSKLRAKLNYYNSNIQSLALSSILGKIHVPPINDDRLKIELRIYCDCPTCAKLFKFKKADRKLFLQLREAEINRILSDIEGMNFKEKIEYAINNILGFKLGITGIFDNSMPDNIDPVEKENLSDIEDSFYSKEPTITLVPKNSDEVKIYNEIIINSYNTKASKSSIKYTYFDFESEKQKLISTIQNAIDPDIIVDSQIEQIEKRFNYHTTTKPEPKQKFRTTPLYEVYFNTLALGNEIDLYATKIKEHDYITYLQTIEFYQYYKLLRSIKAGVKSDLSLDDNDSKESKLSNAEQVLIFYYLFDYLKLNQIDRSVKARFIKALTDKSYKNIYDALGTPLGTKNSKSFRQKELQKIRVYFENLGLDEIVKAINKELETH